MSGEEGPPKKKQKAGAGEVVLYSYWRSSCSWRVRIALAMKNIEYEYRAVHLLKGGGEQFSDSYVEMNPSRELPTLVIDGHTLCQSLAIIEYLEETRGGPKLLGEDPYTRQQIRRQADLISGIQSVQNLRVLLKLMSVTKDPAERTKIKLAHGKWAIENGFTALESVLKNTSGKYCVGDSISMADLCLVPQVYNARRFGCDMEKFPTILKIEAELSSVPAFKEAHPSSQPDAQ